MVYIMISFVDGSFSPILFHGKVRPWMHRATPKGRLRATPETSAAIKADTLGVHNPLWHGPTHPWQRDAFRTGRATKWKMEPCHLLASGTAAHASRSVTFLREIWSKVVRQRSSAEGKRRSHVPSQAALC